MFSDTQDQGVVRGNNLHEGGDGGYRGYFLVCLRVQQPRVKHMRMLYRM
jgi:hypothetical protein